MGYGFLFFVCNAPPPSLMFFFFVAPVFSENVFPPTPFLDALFRCPFSMPFFDDCSDGGYPSLAGPHRIPTETVRRREHQLSRGRVRGTPIDSTH